MPSISADNKLKMWMSRSDHNEANKKRRRDKFNHLFRAPWDCGPAYSPYMGIIHINWCPYPEYYDKHGLFPPPTSPLVLDLDGDGVETGERAYMDYAGDGFHEQTNWAGTDDGVLFLDRNSDGLINDGSELFGNHTPLASGDLADHGFSALADLDSNGDGQVDASDSSWSSLKVMVHRTGETEDDEGGYEAVSLTELGIASLGTGYVDSDHVDEQGNEHRQVGSYTKADGTTRTMTDVWFQTDMSETTYSDADIPVHDESIEALPDVVGAGMVYDLRDAMALDRAGRLSAPIYAGRERVEQRKLHELVEAFSNSDDAAQRDELLDRIIQRWTGAEGVVAGDYWPGHSRVNLDPHKLAAVEAFNGERWLGETSYRNPTIASAQIFNVQYSQLREHVHGSLMLQTHLKDLFLATEAATDENGEVVGLDTSGALALIGSDASRRAEYVRALVGLTQGRILPTDSALSYEYRYQHAVMMKQFESGAGQYSGSDRSEAFHSADGSSDVYSGQDGNDVYLLGSGTGFDAVDESATLADSASQYDSIMVASGYGPDDVRLRRDESHLWVELLGSAGEDDSRPVTDSLRVHEYFHSESSQVEQVVFSDGTIWGIEHLRSVPLRGAAGDDSLFGSATSDIFDSDGGGNDRLYGRGGNDVYRLRSGTGHDVIHEGVHSNRYRDFRRDPADAGDVIEVEAGYGPGDVRLRRDEHHLWVELLGPAGEGGVREATDSLKVHEYFNGGAHQVESVRLHDGTTWTDVEFRAVALRGGPNNEDIHGRSDKADIFDSDGGGDDRLYGRGGDDVYRLGSGTGHDVIHEGLHSSRYMASRRDPADAGDAIEVEAGYGAGDVRLRRDEHHLWVELLGAAGEGGSREVTDSLKVHEHFNGGAHQVESVRLHDGTTWGDADFRAVALRGGEGNEDIHGRSDMADIFDSDGGGDDRLYGRGGDDVYRLGSGTGHDVIHEGLHSSRYMASRRDPADAGDAIEVEAGYGADDVRLRRDEHHLWVELLGAASEDGSREVTDSLRVHEHFKGGAHQVESVLLHDGTTWTDADFRAVALRGGEGNEDIHGRSDMADIFDSDGGGDDRLYGRGGDDVYRLGSGTGHDVIHEGLHSSRYMASRRDPADAGDAIEVEAGYGPGDVRLRRDEHHLWVELLGPASEGGSREVTDSLKVHEHFKGGAHQVESVRLHDGTTWTDADFRAVALRGGEGNEDIHGRSDMADVFDSDGGGNDRLYGRGGNDVYRLGSGTGHDVIHEGLHSSRYMASRRDPADAGDVIEVEAGYGPGDVRLRRDEHHLWVELLGPASEGGSREVTDSLKVHEHFKGGAHQVESVRLHDGTTWTDADFRAVALRGGEGNEDIHGRSDMADVFDSDGGGNDRLYGRGGNDVYRLGSGTGHDVIHEGLHSSRYMASRRDPADAGDAIEVEAGYGPGDVRLRRDEHHLWVELLGPASEGGSREVTDSLKVHEHFKGGAHQVESVRLHDGTTWTDADFRAVALRGGEGNEDIHGRSDMADIFDSDDGGNDRLYGRGGDDVYRLGSGTGHDVIHEGVHSSRYRDFRRDPADAGDVIEVEAGYGPGDVRLRRDEHHLWVELLGPAGEDGNREATDSLKVHDYFKEGVAEIESIRFASGAEWQGKFVVGTSGSDSLSSEQGGSTIYGGEGDDTYSFASGFGTAQVVDTGGSDRARFNDWAHSDLQFSREGSDMVVDAGGGDRAVFAGWFDSEDRRIEQIEAGDSHIMAAQAERMASAMSQFISDGGTASGFTSQAQGYWEQTLGTPGG